MGRNILKILLLAAALTGSIQSTANERNVAAKNDVKLSSARMPEYAVTGEKIEYIVTFINNGTEPVNSLSIEWLKDGESIAEETVDNLNITTQNEGSVELKDFSLDKEGDYNISLKISKVNGNNDEMPSDNISPTVRTICRNAFTKRKTLLEFFSTERCTSCPSAHYAIDKIFDGKNDIVEIGHHSGYESDRYTITESIDMEWFFQTGHKYAPAIMIDRRNLGNIYPSVFSNNVPVVNANAANAQLLYAESQTRPALVSIHMAASIKNRKLLLNVSGNQLLPVDCPDSIRLFIYLTEDSIFTENQAGAYGNFYHRFTARKSITPTWGDPIDISGYSKDYSFYIPKTWNIDKLNIAVFVANYNATDKNDCMVMNADDMSVIDLESTTGITEELSDTDSSWQIMSVSGIMLYSGKGKNSLLKVIGNMPHGILIVKTNTKTIKINI